MATKPRIGAVDRLLDAAAEAVFDGRVDVYYAASHMLGVQGVDRHVVRMELAHYTGVWNRLHLVTASMNQADRALRAMRDLPTIRRASAVSA